MTIDIAKRNVFEAALELGVVLLGVDTRLGTVVPTKYMNQPSLTLRFGHALVPPISMNVDDSGIAATLSFEDRTFECWLPWSAIFAIKVESSSSHLFVWGYDEKVPVQTDKPRAKLSLVPEDA